MSARLNLFQPLTDFEERLPHHPYYGKDKKIDGILCRDRARNYPYIQINFPLLHYLCFDCDSDDAAFRPGAMGLPVPTLSVIAPETGHAHLLYELFDPIPRRGKSTETRALLRDVISGYKTRLEADRCISLQHQLIKNPLCTKWDVLEGPMPFSLSELVEFVPKEFERKSRPEISARRAGIESLAETRERMALEDGKIPDSRNCSIFENSRIYAYSVVAEHSSYQSLFRAVLDYIENLNDNQIPDCFPGKGKIPSPRELKDTAKSIAGFTFRNRANFSKVDRGVMGFQPLEELHLEGGEYSRELSRRNRLSAERTHGIRKERTREKIKDATYLCIRRGIDLKPENIGTLAGVSRRTVYNHMKLVRELTEDES